MFEDANDVVHVVVVGVNDGRTMFDGPNIFGNGSLPDNDPRCECGTGIFPRGCSSPESRMFGPV